MSHFFWQAGQDAYRRWLYAALGILGASTDSSKPLPKLPTHKIDAVPVGQGFYVWLAPQGPQPVLSSGSLGKRSTHRIFVICTCGQHIPAGRMRQHYGTKTHDEALKGRTTTNA